MNKTVLSSLTGILIAFVAFSLFWTLKSKENTKTAGIETSDQQIKNGKLLPQEPSQKVRRKISYLGRMEEAQKLIDHEYYSLATLEISEAIKEKPNLVEPYRLLGEIYLRTNDFWKLENLIAQMEKKFPGNSEILVLKTRQLIAARKFDDVLAILATTPDVPPTLKFYEAVLQALQNDHESARATLKEISKIKVREKEFIVEAGGLTEAENQEPFLLPAVAQKIADIKNIYLEFDELVEAKDAHLFATLSKSLAEHNEGLLAREFADVAIKEDVHYIDGWLLRGYAQLVLQDFLAAEKDFRQAYELDPLRPETQYFLALSLYEQQKYPEAALFFEKALDYEFEFSAEVRWKLLEIFSAQKKYTQVIDLYRQLLDYNTEAEKFINAVHTAVDLLKKPKVALEFSQILIDENPEEPFVLNIHAWALLANEKYVEAKQYLEKSLSLDKENPRTYLNLGLLYEKQRQFPKAKEMYKKSYDLGSDRPEFVGVVNLAVEKHNALLEEERPEIPAIPENPPNSP